MIYILKSKDLIKVGYTKDFKSRFNNYKTHNPHIEVLFKYPELPLSLEQELHSELKNILKVTEFKEWYLYQEDVLTIIDNALDGIIKRLMKDTFVDLENYVILPNSWVVNLDLLKGNIDLKIFKTFTQIIEGERLEDDINTYDIPYKDGSVSRYIPLFKSVSVMKEILSNPIYLYMYKYGEVDKNG